MDTAMRDALTLERERAREWHELVNKVALQQQTIEFLQQQIAELRESTANNVRARELAFESLRQKDLVQLAEAIEEKYDRAAFLEFRNEVFNPVKNKAEAGWQFQITATVLVSLTVLIVPALTTAILRHFWP